ncbi:hypothetical protein GLAREA_03933 [Glarea lozoyensis ATCC 20868]|uniref:Uncharacterized protein n=1 Tax=Glarea lozoyensis (strain ATCC 20868 / MF5171) TaxID=1116229 RepID=S3DG35_GLAL2|nr:uncharacterized protein GLAREA_03933 [Glarea lozoyensis ATCC 20868]EPE30966.1 hypothetical protein GLAREA_03933 [Glarea lozoyensis ATCC 20868]
MFSLPAILLLLSLTHASPLEKCSVPLQMGLAKSFAALSATTLTSTGATALTGVSGVGDGGVWPGTAIVGFPPGTASGQLEAGTVTAQDGEAACLTAYNAALALVPTAALPSSDLGGVTLEAGVYTFPSSAVVLSSTLTLSGAGQFVFQILTTFEAAAAAKVVLANGAQACNVYFIVGSSATIGAAAEMKGNIIAYTAIGASEAASNSGTWCALNAAVTLIDNALQAQAGTCE